MVHVRGATLIDSLIDACHEIYMATQSWWSAACPDTPLKSELSFFLTIGKSTSPFLSLSLSLTHAHTHTHTHTHHISSMHSSNHHTVSLCRPHISIVGSETVMSVALHM